MLEELSVRQGKASTGSSVALPSDYITRPVALVQHCIVAEEQWAAAAAGRLRNISLVCVLHKTITLHLTAVKSRSDLSI